jgi:hypothetical protein
MAQAVQADFQEGTKEFLWGKQSSDGYEAAARMRGSCRRCSGGKFNEKDAREWRRLLKLKGQKRYIPTGCRRNPVDATLVDGQSLYPKGPKSWSHKGIQELESGSGFSPPVDDRLATRKLRRARRSPTTFKVPPNRSQCDPSLVRSWSLVGLPGPSKCIVSDFVCFLSSSVFFFSFFLSFF